MKATGTFNLYLNVNAMKISFIPEVRTIAKVSAHLHFNVRPKESTIRTPTELFLSEDCARFQTTEFLTSNI